VSLDAQKAKAKAYAELYDLDIVEVVIDSGVSAKTLARPGLERALGLLKSARPRRFLVVKLDRLTRSVAGPGSPRGAVTFAPGKAALLSVGEQIDTRSAGGRLVLNVLARREPVGTGSRRGEDLGCSPAQGRPGRVHRW